MTKPKTPEAEMSEILSMILEEFTADTTRILERLGGLPPEMLHAVALLALATYGRIHAVTSEGLTRAGHGADVISVQQQIARDLECGPETLDMVADLAGRFVMGGGEA